MQSISLGPWMISLSLVALVLGMVVAELAAAFLARRGQADVGTPIYALLIVALLAGRVVFVARWWSVYAAHPWDILNVRDGGFDLLGALLALLVVLALMLWRRASWRWPLLVAVALGVATWASIGMLARQWHDAGRLSLPALTLRDLEGHRVDVAGLRGKPLVINFWATWCPPCRREMPVLAQAQQRYPQVRFVFADQGESAPPVRSYLAAQDLALRNVLLDENMALAHHYRVRGYPTTLFIDADGRLREMHTGELSHATLLQQLGRITTVPSTTGAAKR